MNMLKLISVPVTLILAVLVLLLIISLLLQHFKSKYDVEHKFKISYSIWFTAIFISGSLVIKSIIQTAIEIADNLGKIRPANLILELVKANSLVLGVSFIWLLLWYFIVKFIMRFVTPNNNEEQEMNDDGSAYFLIRGGVFLSLILSTSSVLDAILRYFVPSISVPFFH